jgi:urea transport system ATP-binding protein
MLDVERLTLRYGQSRILHGIDLHARAGEVTAVMGMNGVGKTSLLKAIAGRHPFEGGTIRLDGRDLGRPTAARAAQAGIAYVPQGREIFPLLTVQENLEAGFACLPRAKREVPAELYELFPILRTMRNRRGGDLSGGQQQQLAIARALSSNPKVLLLDEPTEGVQPSVIKDIARVLNHIKKIRDLTILVSEQILSFALDIADRILVIDGGRIVHSEDRATVDERKVAKFLSV